MMKIHLLSILIVLCCAVYSEGTKHQLVITLKKNSSYAKPTEACALTCSIKLPPDVYPITVQVLRQGITIYSFDQSQSTCNPKKGDESSFEGSCGPSGTYNVVIPKPSDLIAGSYACSALNNDYWGLSNMFFLYFIDYVMTLKGSAPHTNFGWKFTFECFIDEAEGVNGRICFNRGKNHSWCFQQKYDVCYVIKSTNIPGYDTKCGAGTDYGFSSRKNYELTIHKVKAVDSARWWCQLSIQVEVLSNYIDLDAHGLSATLIWYTPFAIWGKPYTFRCRITDAAELFDQMCFHREKDSWCFHQKYAECVVPVSDAFVLGCDNGTHTKASPTKVYSLQIKSASPADGKKWWCELRKNSVLSKVFKLGVRNLTVTLKGSSPFAVIQNNFDFTCVVANGAIEETIVFYTNDAIVASLSQTAKTCSILKKPATDGHEVKCGKGTMNEHANVKNYKYLFEQVLPSDLKDWSCKMKNMDTRSNVIKLTVKGIYVILKWSAAKADRGSKFTFTCLVGNSEKLNDDIQFLREEELVNYLIQKNDRCSPSVDKMSEKYQVTCEKGTDMTMSNIKTYTLDIEPISSVDGGKWWCVLKATKIRSKNFTLEFTEEEPKVDRYEMTPGSIAAVIISVLVVIVLIMTVYGYRRWRQAKIKEAKAKKRKKKIRLKHHKKKTDGEEEEEEEEEEEDDDQEGTDEEGDDKASRAYTEKSGYEETDKSDYEEDKKSKKAKKKSDYESSYSHTKHSAATYDNPSLKVDATDQDYDPEREKSIYGNPSVTGSVQGSMGYDNPSEHHTSGHHHAGHHSSHHSEHYAGYSSEHPSEHPSNFAGYNSEHPSEHPSHFADYNSEQPSEHPSNYSEHPSHHSEHPSHHASHQSSRRGSHYDTQYE